MIINDDKGFVYLHIPKNGGNSVLRPLFNTPTPDKKILYNQDLVIANPKYKWNFHHDHNYCSNDDLKYYKDKGYFIFSFVRNPYDRIISIFFWRNVLFPPVHRQFFEKQSLIDFIRGLTTNSFWWPRWPKSFLSPQTSWLKSSSIDFVGKIENYTNDMIYVCDRLKIPHISWRKLNVNHLRPDKHYSTFYDTEMFDLVSEFYKDDISILNYCFEDMR
jgi:hypothetical protein